MKLDPVRLEILNNKVAAVADEMAFTLQRASRSLYAKEAADFAVGLVDRRGKVFGYPAAASVPFYIDCDCASAIAAAGPLEPGDVVVTNDPYLSHGLATHLPDVHLIRPYFHRRRLVAYGWAFTHFTDVGGAVPSSVSPRLSEIYQEGLRIPPMKIVRRGVLNDDFMALFGANTRTPELNRGDVRALLGALEIGARRVAALIERHGVGAFLACQTELQDYAALKARVALRRIPDGSYGFWDYLDDDFASPVPLRVRARLTARDGEVEIDVTGSDPQVPAAYNIPTMGARNYRLTIRLTSFILTVDPGTPMNAGLYRPIRMRNPPGTVINAEFPDAVGVRHATTRRLNEAVTGAILKASPEILAAPACGASVPLVLAEDQDGGRPRVTVLEPLRGGMGAGKGFDGVDGRDATTSNMRNHPIETVEAETGVVVREYDVRPDSGGPGRWRGGCGQMITIEARSRDATVLARGMDRLRFPAWGVAGGRPGAPCRAIVNRGRPGEREILKIDRLHLGAGQTLTIMMPGAGGYGDPFLRDPEKVRADVELGFVSAAAASDYGVVIAADGSVDVDATRRLRNAQMPDNAHADFDFGPEREAWEAVFDDATMREINRRLYALPKSVRYDRRRRVFERALPDLSTAGGAPLATVLKDPDAVRRRLARAMRELLPPPDFAAGQGASRVTV